MSLLTDVMDRLTDISSLRTQVTELIQQQREMRNIMLTQQRELAEVRGQLKALIQMQGFAGKKG
jgi:peptidoglycan hydrolase CwlO-like protein